MAEQNSISTFLPEFLRMFNNSIESFEKINEAITSNQESITLDVQDTNGNISSITIPSFGFLKNSVDRLDRNLNSIVNVDGGGNSSVRLPDGSFRKIVLSSLPSEAKDISEINSVNEFNIKPNWFFEELINPLLYVSFNVTGQVPITTERSLVRRYILDTNTQSKKNLFDDEYKGRSDISYDSFIQDMVEKNISYVLDEGVIDLPPRNKKFYGKFSVIRIDNIEITEEVNGVDVTTEKKLYKLNKISYSNNEDDFSDTLQLKIGDTLEVTSDPVDTRYRVIRIDSSKNTCVLELLEGSKPINIGVDVLKIGSGLNNNVNVDVTVGFDERCVTFIKPIDPNSKMPAINWSPGSAFYTNDLVVINEDGNEERLSDFYQNSAIDFGKFLLSFAQDKFPTSKEGLIPAAPELIAEDFNVVEINKQVTESKSIVEIEDLNTQKNSVQSKLKELNNAISKKRNRIQTTNYTTEVERDTDKSELDGFINERLSQAKLYSSIVNEISAKAKDNSIISISPKYRVRGFWKLPEEKSSQATGVQEIIKFKIRYRYLSQDGAANPVNEFKFKDGEIESQGAFSNYVEIESNLRPRIKDKVINKYIWGEVNNENAEENNINQLDIPIRKGEIVEVQVKSVSEAGWPSNPLESSWSTPIRVEFPVDLSSNNAVEDILEQNKNDLSKVNLEEDLDAKGIDQHLSSQFTTNDNFFAHNANTIASGFLSENQTPIDLFSKLKNMQNKLTQLEEILSNARGELSISIIDENGDSIKINRNETTKIFSGFYSEEVFDLDDPRGAIISKTFYLNIANSQQTPLQLISSIAGSRVRMVKQSETSSFTESEAAGGNVILPATYQWLDNSEENQSNNRPTYLTNDSEYNTIRKYDLVPITLINPLVDINNKYSQIKSLSPYQSAQNKNQYLYSRFSDVSSDSDFYSYINPDDDFIINLDSAENLYGRESNTTLVNGTPNDFIWGGGFDEDGNPTLSNQYYNDNDNTIEVHIEHPYVQNFASYKNSYIELTGDDSNLTLSLNPSGFTDCTEAGNGTASILFRQSKFAPLKSDENKGKQQSIYLNENHNRLNQLPSLNNYPSALMAPNGNQQTLQGSPSINRILNTDLTNFSRNVKNSFGSFDQYLIGKKSCGSYLFLAANDHENIQVEGDSIQSAKMIKFGQQNSINIPIVFQYRMTDYYGAGDGASGGIGNIGGDTTSSTTNLTYAKRIGIDLNPNEENTVQFDLEFFAKYKSDNLNINVFPSATVTKSINDLNQVISNLTPNIRETE